ncbi:B3 domain-containing protein At3g19184-like isoform X2 [Mercurialis annua]|nr:B3 domain-containing protein At3g19184-like isoform X2 [Mercurialis annua]
MVVSKSNYEAVRNQRLEENKKRMEELNLKILSDDFRSSSPKKSPMKRLKPRVLKFPEELVAVRRSSRFKASVSYKELAPEPIERPSRRFVSCRSYSCHRRDLANRIYASDEVRAYAIDRAEQLQARLEPQFPSFVKPMLQSHVTGGFWLGLPVQFCDDHLPCDDEYMSLVDENGDSSETKYLARKHGLSGGWRGFAIDHKLVDGDALVFQLISRKEFKVFIIRGNEYGDDGHDKEDVPCNEHDKEDVP